MDLSPCALLAEPKPQRADGAVDLFCGLVAGKTRPIRLRQEGSAKIRLLPSRSGVLEGLMINAAGGLTGGDRLRWSIDVGPGARASLSTTSCERLYRSAGDAALVEASLNVGAGASLDWIPQETILFDRACLERRITATVAVDGRLLIAESVLLGRRAMGETAINAFLRERWRVHRDGKLIFADDIRLDGPLMDSGAGPAILNGATTYAALLLIAPDAESYLGPLRTVIGDSGGASAFGGKLFCRLTAADGFELRRALIPAMAVLRPGAESQRVWSF